ncbi:hypothetical protein ETB97_004249 [Aspergillus alliaceus]|uniref:Uncharacterized protein n=1 Tax=Petromyces alliaceus TaxID=209559 RepID=A0A8H6A0U5_PETAA|nr:hypothetical protein ETB97_004249 [Aspergillus burnettii]
MANETEYVAPVSFNKTWHTEPYPFISPPRPELTAKGKIVVVLGFSAGIGTSATPRHLHRILPGRTHIHHDHRPTPRHAPRVRRESHRRRPTAAGPGRPGIPVHHEQTRQERRQGDKCRVAPRSGIPHRLQARGPSPLVDGNLRMAMNAFQAFLPFAGPEPVDFSTSTCLANIASTPRLAGYTISKAACLKTMDYFAMENPNVRVISVQQGWVATASNGFQKEAPDKSELPGQFYIWLASPEDKFLKGKFVWANWGCTGGVPTSIEDGPLPTLALGWEKVGNSDIRFPMPEEVVNRCLQLYSQVLFDF